MPIGRSIRGGRRRAIVAALALVLAWALAPGVRAGTEDELGLARARLAELEQRIAENSNRLAALDARVRAVQGELDAMADELLSAQDRFDRIQSQTMATREALDATRAEYRGVRGQLDARARAAYLQGPAGDLAMLLGSTSINDLSDRLEFMSGISATGAELAAEVQRRANHLAERRRELEGALAEQIRAVQDMEADRSAMDERFAEHRSLFDEQAAILSQLAGDRAEAEALVQALEDQLREEELAAAREAARLAAIQAAQAAAQEAAQGSGGTAPPVVIEGLGPFSVCPVDEPRAYGDGFGAPRYGGGYHPHAGNDILAPTGTPVRATFDGFAEARPNTLGGLAVIVTGAEGYTYNAHFSRYGTLGHVTAGTVIGYVGDSGNAQGGPPHNHFEWHPNVIPADLWTSPYGYRLIEDAVDPYPYLNLVC